jgi:hypothetical protein
MVLTKQSCDILVIFSKIDGPLRYEVALITKV